MKRSSHKQKIEVVPDLPVLIYNSLEYTPPTHYGPGQNGRRFAVNIFRCIFVTKNYWTPVQISLNFSMGPINHKPALAYVMTW